MAYFNLLLLNVTINIRYADDTGLIIDPEKKMTFLTANIDKWGHKISNFEDIKKSSILHSLILTFM